MGLQNRKKIVIFSIFILIFISFLYYNGNEQREIYSQSEFFMDTLVTIKVEDEKGAEKAVEDSFTVMKNCAEELDRYNQESKIFEINNEGIKGVSVSDELFDLLITAGEYFRQSNGAFDITVAPLVNLWGFGSQQPGIPEAEEISNVLSKIGFEKIKMDDKEHKIFLQSGMQIDLGGMAKGFIVDQGTASLKRSGIDSAFINAGGNIRVLGGKYDSSSWKIGIRKPRAKDKIFSDYILSMKRGSVATSGDYERYFIVDGKRYCHLLDPATGYPSREMQAVTIYAPDALTADILSTSVFIMGWEKGQVLIEKLADVEGLLIKDEKNIWQSSGFKDLVANQ